MDGWQFSAEVIKALAWPGAVVLVAWMFKGNLRRLLDNVKRAKAAGFEFDFSQEIKKVAEEAEQVQAVEEVKSVLGDGEPVEVILPPFEEQRRLAELLRERPSALILDSWRDVEKSMLDVLGELDLYGRAGRRNPLPPQYPGLLEANNVLSHEEAALVSDLSRLRNRVAHTADWEPTASDAFAYHRSATLLANVLRTKLAEIKQLKK